MPTRLEEKIVCFDALSVANVTFTSIQPGMFNNFSITGFTPQYTLNTATTNIADVRLVLATLIHTLFSNRKT